ncbi:Ran GAP Rna1, partial [Tilletia horrida]
MSEPNLSAEHVGHRTADGDIAASLTNNAGPSGEDGALPPTQPASADNDEDDEQDKDEGEDEEEEAVTIPIAPDTVPASHPAAEQLSETLAEEEDIIADAAEEAGLGTAVGAGLSELLQADASKGGPADGQPQQDESTASESEVNDAHASPATPAPLLSEVEASREGSPQQEAVAAKDEAAEQASQERNQTEAKPIEHATAEPASKVFSLLGKNLKLNSAEDAAPYCEELEAIEGLEEIHLGGNTLGQGA